MHNNRFHDTWVWLSLALLINSAPIYAQCPDTKSASYAMVEQGLPNREKLEPTDFFTNLADTSLYAELTISEDRFLCIDVGIREILLSGVTILGDSFSCEEYVWVYDSVFLCSSTIETPKAVAGKVTTETNAAMSNIALGLSNGSANYFQGTSEQGTFFFEDFEPQNYQLTPSNPFDENIRNGITTFDVLLLQKHILGIRPLDSPYKILAADLNSSGDITAYDMLILRQMILSIIDEFPNNTPSWRFIDANYEFEDGKDPLEENAPSSINLDTRTLAPQLDIRFIAIKMGDFNNTVETDTKTFVRSYNRDAVNLFAINDQFYETEETVKIPFVANESMELEGLQLAFNFDENKLEFIGLESMETTDLPHYQANNGVVTISWTAPAGREIKKENALFQFVFRAKTQDQLMNSFRLTNKYLSPEIYTTDAVIPLGVEWKNTLENAAFQAFNNYPNPFSVSTTIPFFLPKNGCLLVAFIFIG